MHTVLIENTALLIRSLIKDDIFVYVSWCFQVHALHRSLVDIVGEARSPTARSPMHPLHFHHTLIDGGIRGCVERFVHRSPRLHLALPRQPDGAAQSRLGRLLVIERALDAWCWEWDR